MSELFNPKAFIKRKYFVKSEHLIGARTSLGESLAKSPKYLYGVETLRMGRDYPLSLQKRHAFLCLYNAKVNYIYRTNRTLVKNKMTVSYRPTLMTDIALSFFHVRLGFMSLR